MDSAHRLEGMSLSALLARCSRRGLSRPCIVETQLSWPSRKGRENSPPTSQGCPSLAECPGSWGERLLWPPTFMRKETGDPAIPTPRM